MIEISKVQVFGWESAIYGMRNPFLSWGKSDSSFDEEQEIIGKDDLKLMTRLAAAGTDHRKFMRMVVVYADINAPLYW